MGTKLHHAINLLPTLPNNKVEAVDIPGVNTSLKENIRPGLNQLEESMDRLLEHYNGDSIKKTMLKQEEIFRSQVTELHRLYRVQKRLMSELRSKELEIAGVSSARPGGMQRGPDYREHEIGAGFWSTSASPQASSSPLCNNLQNYSFRYRHNYTSAADPSSQEPSCSSQDNYRVHLGFDLERPAEQEPSVCLSAIEEQRSILFGRNLKDKRNSGDTAEGENDVELTLSIGCGANKKKSQERKQQNPTITDQAEGEQESLKRPHWLFQALSINRT